MLLFTSWHVGLERPETEKLHVNVVDLSMSCHALPCLNSARTSTSNIYLAAVVAAAVAAISSFACDEMVSESL